MGGSGLGGVWLGWGSLCWAGGLRAKQRVPL